MTGEYTARVLVGPTCVGGTTEAAARTILAERTDGEETGPTDGREENGKGVDRGVREGVK